MLISISIRVLEYRFRLCLICGLQLDAWQAVFGGGFINVRLIENSESISRIIAMYRTIV